MVFTVRMFKFDSLSDLNGDKSKLKGLINSRIAKIAELKNNASSDATDFLVIERLVTSVDYLSVQLSKNGMIVDPLSGKKYFLTDTRLLGGGAGYAKNVKNYEKYLLYNNKGNLAEVKKSVDYFNDKRIANRQSRVYIVI